MAEVLDALKAADAIVLASPVYFYSVCAQMKAMIDRCMSDYMDIGDKTFYLIVTAAALSTAPPMRRWRISGAISAVCPGQRRPGCLNMKKLLTVYYSWSYGNTERIAQKLQSAVGGDLLRIDTAVSYSGSYDEVVEQGQREVDRGAASAVRLQRRRPSGDPGT